MPTVENCRICRGYQYENFQDVVPVNENEPVFHTKRNDGAAYIEYRHSHFHEKIIRSMSCMVFLPGSDDVVHKRTVCEFASKQNTICAPKKSRYHQRSQDEKNDESTAKLKPGQTFAVMFKEELLEIIRQQSSELKALHKRVKR